MSGYLNNLTSRIISSRESIPEGISRPVLLQPKLPSLFEWMPADGPDFQPVEQDEHLPTPADKGESANKSHLRASPLGELAFERNTIQPNPTISKESILHSPGTQQESKSQLSGQGEMSMRIGSQKSEDGPGHKTSYSIEKPGKFLPALRVRVVDRESGSTYRNGPDGQPEQDDLVPKNVYSIGQNKGFKHSAPVNQPDSSQDGLVIGGDRHGPDVRVHIGRIEVKAVVQSAPARPRRLVEGTKLSLDEYLKQRSENKR